MSRSKRKPYYTDQQNSDIRHAKRAANKAIRLLGDEDVPNGKGYKRYYDSWDIRDWSFHSPKDKKAYRK